jgi:hypothetical protein
MCERVHKGVVKDFYSHRCVRFCDRLDCYLFARCLTSQYASTLVQDVLSKLFNRWGFAVCQHQQVIYQAFHAIETAGTIIFELIQTNRNSYGYVHFVLLKEQAVVKRIREQPARTALLHWNRIFTHIKQRRRIVSLLRYRHQQQILVSLRLLAPSPSAIETCISMINKKEIIGLKKEQCIIPWTPWPLTPWPFDILVIRTTGQRLPHTCLLHSAQEVDEVSKQKSEGKTEV